MGITGLAFVDTPVKCSVDTRNNEREIEAMTAIPKPWMDLMDQQGITSIRQLAKIAGIVTSTGREDHTRLTAVITRGATTSEENMAKVAKALNVPVEYLYGITSGVEARPLTMPAGSEKLSERQKNAVAEIIRTMIEEKENAAGIVDKKSAGSAEQAQEKMAGVTPIGGYKWRTPAQQRFEDAGRRVAKITREIAQDSPKIPPTSSDTEK